MIKKAKATGTFVEVQADKLLSPDFSGVSEGEDVSSFTNQVADRARIGNYVQKFRETWKVSDIQQLVDTAGVASEKANSAGKSVRNIKRSIEAAFCSSQDRQAEAGSGTPYKTRGMFKWLGVGGQPSDVPSDYSKKITLTVNFYEGDFGNVAVIPTLWNLRTSGSDTVDGDAGLLIDPEYVAMHTLKAESATSLEDQGGGARGYVDVICALSCLSPKAHGYFN